MSCIINSDSHFNYPFTKRVSQVDDYFGTKVEDPYRWLEDLDSKEVLSGHILNNLLLKII